MGKYFRIFLNHYQSRKSISLFWYWILLRVQKLVKYNFKTDECDISRQIDVVIPTISKDFETLQLLIESLKFLKHSINTVYIVAPENEAILHFCNTHNIIFINEKGVLGFGKDRIHYTVQGIDRSGWLFQQLLKLSGENFTQMEDYLVIDSDTIFVNDNCFIEKGKYIYFGSEEWHQPYFDTFFNIFGYVAPTKLSLTSHMMIFNHGKLREMKQEIETKHAIPWHDAYINTKSTNELSCISDYETYANWMLCHYPHQVKVLPFYNKSVSKTHLTNLEYLLDNFSSSKSISFHSYID